MADPLKLLFELDADGEPSVKEFKRVSAAFATEIASIRKLAESAVKLSLVESRPARPSDGAAANKSTLDSQREVNRQLESMWAAREKEQAASAKKQSDIDRGFATQQVATARTASDEIIQAYKDRESQSAKTAKQSEDAWSKHEAAKLNATKQAEKEGEATVAAANAAKDKAAKAASDNFLKQQKQTAAIVAKANAQTAANEIRAALVAAKSTADISSIASKGIESLGEHLNLLVGHRIPLAGGAFIRLTENVRGFVTLSRETEGSVLRLGNLIADLSSKTGKSAPEIKDFLASFSKLGSQIEKDEAAVNAFGPALAQKLIPQLAAADSEMTALAASTGEAGGAFAALAGPIGIAVLAVAAVVAVAAEGVKKMFDLAEASAEVEGRFVDLSQQVGISTELLSAFDILASTTGTDIGSLSASFGIFQKHLEDAQDPMSASAGLLGELGIQTTDTETALRQTFATLAKLPEGFRQTALALQLFGRGGKSVLAIIKETNGDLDTAIKRFRDLGLIVSLEDAKAADKFNDELEILNRQITDLTVELGKEFLPAALDIVRTFSDLIKSSRGFFDLIGSIGKPAIDTFARSLTGLSLVLAAVRHDAEETARILKDLEDRRTIKPLEVPDVTPVPLPGPPTALQKAREDLRLVRAEVSGAVRFAESQVAEIDRQLQLREISPAQALEPIIAIEKQKTEAVIKGLEAQREARAKEFIKDEQDRQKMADDIQAIDEQIASKRAELDKFEADRRAQFRAQELQREQEHRRALAGIFLNALNDRIDLINRSAQAGINSQLFAQDVTTELLKAEFDKRKEVLEKERAEAGRDPALAQQINAQLADLQRERTSTLAEQSDRRIEILGEENRKALDLQRSTIDSLLRASEITDSSRIATIKSLAALRVKTEEDAAREILKIRLDAIDREKGLVFAERQLIDRQLDVRLDAFSKQRQKLEAALGEAGGIADPSAREKEKTRIRLELQANVDAEIDAQQKANRERTDADTDLNNKLRILGAQRSQIEADGNRDTDKGRQDDLANERRYADDLKQIQAEIADAFRDNQKLIIDLMTAAPARQILAARIALERADEDARHQRALDSIVRQRRENAESNRTQEEKNAKTAELNRRAEAEEERHRLEQKRIHDEETRDLERLDPNSTRSLFGEIFADAARVIREAAAEAEVEISSLQVILGGFGAAAAEHFASASASAGNFISILLDGIDSINAGLADMLENWILTGETGSGALRKLLASTLAYYAKTFLIKALDNVGEGFSNLAKASAAAAAGNFFSAGLYHDAAIKNFLSAAKYGLASAGIAVAGRFAAGDSFRQKDTASRAVNGGQDAQPRNQNFNLGGQGPVESSSQAAREGSGGLLSRREANDRAIVDALNNHTAATLQLNSTISRLKTEPKGVVVADGLEQNPAAAGRAVLVHSNSDGDFNENLQRNLGFAR